MEASFEIKASAVSQLLYNLYGRMQKGRRECGLSSTITILESLSGKWY